MYNYDVFIVCRECPWRTYYRYYYYYCYYVHDDDVLLTRSIPLWTEFFCVRYYTRLIFTCTRSKTIYILILNPGRCTNTCLFFNFLLYISFGWKTGDFLLVLLFMTVNFYRKLMADALAHIMIILSIRRGCVYRLDNYAISDTKGRGTKRPDLPLKTNRKSQIISTISTFEIR